MTGDAGIVSSWKQRTLTRTQANLILLAVALIWGLAFVAQAEGMAGVGPLTFTGIRFLLGALIVLPLAWREWQQRSTSSSGRRTTSRLRCATFSVLAALACC
ncbi:MAG: EamA-like transporter family protein [Candidatus Accumulibacter sp. BA-94]|nr:MAG: EamA-like transporter family protein [Candidatus Accumulibacter sp. BA-94]